MRPKKTSSPLYIRKPRTVNEIIKESLHYLSTEASYLFPGISICFGLITLSIILCIISGLGAHPNIILFFMTLKGSEKSELVFMIIGILAYLGSLCLLTYVTNKILLMRDHGNRDRPDDNPIPLNSFFFADFSNYILNFLIMFALYFIVDFGLDYLSKSDLLFDPEELYDMSSNYINFFIMSIPKMLVLPVLLYLCFSALFVSLRDNISSTDAIQKVFNLSQKKLKKIWIAGVLVILICYIGRRVIITPMSAYYFFFPFSTLSEIIISCLTYIMTYCLYVYAAFSSIIILGSIEDENEGHYIKSKIDKIEDDGGVPPSV